MALKVKRLLLSVLALSIMAYVSACYSRTSTLAQVVILDSRSQPKDIVWFNERLWVGSQNELSCYRLDGEKLVLISKKRLSVFDLNNCHGRLLVAHKDGVSSLEGEQWRNWNIGQSYAALCTEKHLIAAREQDLFYVSFDGSPHKVQQVLAEKDFFPSRLPRHLCFAKACLWVGTECGLHKHFPSGKWQSFYGDIAYCGSRGKTKFKEGTKGFSGNRVQGILAWGNKVLVATANGLSIITDGKFESITGSEERLAYDDGDIAARWQIGNSALPSNDIRAACYCGEVLTVGTSAGLAVIKNGKVAFTLSDELPNTEITCLCPIGNNQLVVGTTEGLALVCLSNL